MNIKDDPVYQDKLRKMHAVRRYLKIREKVYIARRDAGFNVREEERLHSWLSEYACYLEADAHWMKEDYERRMGKGEPSYEPAIVIPKGDVEKAVKYGCFSQVLGSIKNHAAGTREERYEPVD